MQIYSNLASGSLSSCDEFIATFHSRGLRPETVCPCACSPEGLTVSVRRPGRVGAGSSGRGVLSMAALSCGVIRVDLENSLTSLTIQVSLLVPSWYIPTGFAKVLVRSCQVGNENVWVVLGLWPHSARVHGRRYQTRRATADMPNG